jgi:Uma2 family endonuclease
MPFDIGEHSEPEPDVAVVSGSIRDYTTVHPTTAALLVEVAETSLHYNRTEKGSLYAKAGIIDYWIVNLVDRQLEVYRTPVYEAKGLYGYTLLTPHP